MTSRTRWAIFLISTPLVVLIAVGGLLGATSTAATQASFPQLRVFEEVVSLVFAAYVEEVDVDKVMDGAMRGLADSLDASSAFLSVAEMRAVVADEALPNGDVGLVVTRQFGYLRILGVREGSPAARARLRTGDFIRMIDDAPARDISAFAGMRRLRGAPGSECGGYAGSPPARRSNRPLLPASNRAARRVPRA